MTDSGPHRIGPPPGCGDEQRRGYGKGHARGDKHRAHHVVLKMTQTSVGRRAAAPVARWQGAGSRASTIPTVAPCKAARISDIYRLGATTNARRPCWSTAPR